MPYHDITNARQVAQKMSNLPENLNYQGIKSGVVFTLDNKMTFGLKVSLVSIARATPDVREISGDRVLSAVQGALPPGATVRFYVENRPATRSALAEQRPKEKGGSPLEAMLMANFELLENMRRHRYISTSEAYLTVTLKIPGRPPRRPYTATALAPLVEKAKLLQQRLSRQLTMGGMQAQPMDTQAAWEHIYDYFNPATVSAEKPEYQPQLDLPDLAGVRVMRWQKKKQDAKVPYVASMNAQVACSDIDLDHDDCFTVGSSRVGVVSFLKPKTGSRAGCTDVILQALGGTHSLFMVEYLVVDAPKVRSEINESLDKQEMAANDPTLKAGREVFTRIAEGSSLVQDLDAGEVMTEMSMHAIIFARTQQELDERREATLAAFNSVGGSLSRVAGAGQAIELYLENAPFCGRRSSYQVPAFYRNAVNCMPLVGQWHGTPRGGVLPLRSRSSNVFSIGPKTARNNGVVVCASARSGKSVLVNMLSAGLIHEYDAALTVVDPKRDYVALFMALGAMRSVIHLSPGARLPNGERLCINPFDLPEAAPRISEEKIGFLLELFAALGINDRSGMRMRILKAAIDQFYYRFSEVEYVDGAETMVYRNRGILSDFANVVQNLNTIGNDSVQTDHELAREVRNVGNEFLPYCGATPLGSLLDGHTTIDVSSRYLYLGLGGMMANPQLRAVGMLLGNELTWNRSVQIPGMKVVVMEEAGVARHLPGIVELTDKLYKMGQGLGIIPILVTQEVEDVRAYKGVINNASTRILLASAPSEREEVAQVFGLNEAMRQLHASLGGEAGRFREVLILQDRGDGDMDGDVGQLWLSRTAYWMATSVDEEARYRSSVAQEYFGGDEAMAAMHIAQEEANAA